MSVPARYLGRLLRVALITLLVLLMGLAAALWYVQRDPQGLLQSSLQDLQERTGLHITMESVDVALLPLPSLAVSNAVVQGAGLRFSVGYATLTPNFAKLLLGQFAPGQENYPAVAPAVFSWYNTVTQTTEAIPWQTPGNN